jgi:hypothetical protein
VFVSPLKRRAWHKRKDLSRAMPEAGAFVKKNPVWSEVMTFHAIPYSKQEVPSILRKSTDKPHNSDD